MAYFMELNVEREIEGKKRWKAGMKEGDTRRRDVKATDCLNFGRYGFSNTERNAQLTAN
jgi:hypothetical protein